MKIVETDNFGGYYPDEKFVNLPLLTTDQAVKIAIVINDEFPDDFPRYWKVVNDDYKLRPGKP